MIPFLVPAAQLLAANGIFTLTLNAAFALGFALLGPLVVKVAGAEAVILVVAGLYFLAAVFCFTLPSSPPPTVHRGGSALRARGRGGGAGHGLDVRPAARGAGVHPRQPDDHLVAHLPRDRRLARRRARRPRSGVRAGDPRPQGEGLRGRRAAARLRHRDRDPAAQLVRPVLPPTTGHRGRPDRPRDPARRAVRGRPDQPAPPAGGRAGRARPLRRHVAARGRRGHRVLRRDRLRARRDPVADRSSRRTCRRTSAVGCSASSTCSSRSRASCRSSSSGRSPT